MKRRDFLIDSAIAAGTLITGTGVGNAAIVTQANPVEQASDGIQHGKLVEVPGGSFEVVDGGTKIPVTITLGNFLMSPAEITQQEYEEVTSENPSFHRGADFPVETVSWWDAIRYCNLRSFKEKLDACYNLESGFCDMRKNGYRLPTDAEWTHASGNASASQSAETGKANLGNSDTTHMNLLVDKLRDSGTKPAGSYPANQYGLDNMTGNVWEWCTDYFNPLNEPQASYNPAGPLRGLDRIIRGGCFISTISSWATGYRKCIEPEYKSRFTGFRVCRTLQPEPMLPAIHRSPEWFAQYNHAPAGYETSTGNLSSLVAGISSVAQWQVRRKAIEKKWFKLLGSMDIVPPPPKTRLVSVVHDQNYTGKLMYLQVEPDWWEKIYIMMPAEAMTSPRPVVIVPFYDVDTPAGRDLSGNDFLGKTQDPFAYCAVQKGYIAVAMRWWGESYGEHWTEATANLKLRHPNVSGLGKWVWDAHRLVDYLFTLPEVDRTRIGIQGHSLGGKMALYAPAFDERITAVVSNELGIGLPFSNYDDYWYFGDAIHQKDGTTDNHELIALIAPRPFLLIGGDKYDTEKSWYYINAARAVYKLYGKPENIGYFNHHTGHRPTPEAVWRSNEWLAHYLGPQA
ncbi:MAG: SUMF1/EgtB/PvdO family nonheme iron enzyme [Acidobacteriaceae bacterium]